MREGKNMGIMTTFKKPTLERVRGGGGGAAPCPPRPPIPAFSRQGEGEKDVEQLAGAGVIACAQHLQYHGWLFVGESLMVVLFAWAPW